MTPSRVTLPRMIGFCATLLAMHLLVLAPARAQDAAEFLLRLDRLENENRRLNGQIEEMRFQIRRLEDQAKRAQADNDLRLRDLEGGRGSARPQSPAPVPTTPQRRSDSFDPAQTPNAPGAPRPLTPGGGAATAPGAPLPAGALPPGGRATGDVNAPQVDGLNPAMQPATGDAKSQFDFARALLTRGDNEQAEGAFRDFLKKYPRDRRIADATFHLGESYANRTRHREAAEHFLTVTSKYSGAARAPEAMLKLGISLRGLGAKQEACGTFDQLPKKYPKASAAIRAAVEREKVRGQC